MTDSVGRARSFVRHVVEDDARGEPVVAQDFDTIADLHHHAAVRSQDARALTRFRAVGGIDPHQRHRFADGLLHQRRGRQQVEVEILLDDADAVARQGHGFGADLGGDVREFLTRAARRQGQLAPVLNQRPILVVDGDRDIALSGVRWRRQHRLDRRLAGQWCGNEPEAQQQNFVHDTSPELSGRQCYTITRVVNPTVPKQPVGG